MITHTTDYAHDLCEAYARGVLVPLAYATSVKHFGGMTDDEIRKRLGVNNLQSFGS
jgi:hypothetical protein